MEKDRISTKSISISLLFHAVIIILFMLLNLSFDYEPSEYVELSFGVSDQTGSSGSQGKEITEKVEEVSKPQEKTTTEDENKEVKIVDLPVSQNTEDENVIKPAEDDAEVTTVSKTKNNDEDVSSVTTSGQGNDAEGEGSFGFDINWGGKGIRKIYSYTLPQYPEGVKKEVDIKLQFTILPDGTIGTIIPKIKADTKLENAAINSLRQWRFEALDASQKQIEQTAVIVFPYRLQ
jgi:outer membrane biosynthesis protein TonB